LLPVAQQLIKLPNIASKRWVYTQYDSMVGTGNVSTNAPSDAAIVLAKPTNKALALTTDCNSRYVFADPYKGAMIAVAEAARNIVCSGGKPLGITNCLNFGNPYDPEVYYQFVEAIKGMGAACRRFDTPVTGGNVSFYNQGPDGPVYPTPTIGMVGVLESVNDKMTMDFKQEDDEIYLVGISRNDIGSSEYLHKLKGIEFSPAPYFEIEEECEVQREIRKMIDKKLIHSAHDVSEGGLFVTLMESCFNRNLGMNVVQSQKEIRSDAFWFGESQSRVVVTVSKENRNDFILLLEKLETVVTYLGTVTSGTIVVNSEDWGAVSDWKNAYDNAIAELLAGHESEHALSSL
ncbi:MAG: AIR synthase related protein, partial [Ferruginibacter sp.]